MPLFLSTRRMSWRTFLGILSCAARSAMSTGSCSGLLASASRALMAYRDMAKSLAFYRDILGMKVLFDGQTDPTEGGRLQNYQGARQSRRRVSLSFGAGKKPTLTITTHPGEDIAGEALKLDQVG